MSRPPSIPKLRVLRLIYLFAAYNIAGKAKFQATARTLTAQTR